MYYTKEERVEIMEVYMKNNKNAYAALRDYCNRYPERLTPSKNTFKRIYNKFLTTYSVENKKRAFAANEDEDLEVLLYFQENPTKSIRDASRYLNINYVKIQRCLVKHNYHDYKPLKVQKLHPNDNIIRQNFSQILLDKFNDDANVFDYIFWTDEASFTTAGVYNKGNTHFWAQENPHLVKEIQFQGHMTFNMWSGIFNKRIYYFFYNGSLTGERYLEYLRTNISDIIDNIPLHHVRHMIWQQDGAPCHNYRLVTQFLNQGFLEWIGKKGTIRWPPRSPDLTPLDFFLWGHIKNEVYKDQVNNVLELQQRISALVDNINNSDILPKLSSSILKRLRLCIEKNGSHIEQFLN